jgi:hypothetical protein
MTRDDDACLDQHLLDLGRKGRPLAVVPLPHDLSLHGVKEIYYAEYQSQRGEGRA